jgi:hypothetical protein
MRKAIVIGIILSIAVLIAVVVYLFNTKKEGFQASDPFKARMVEIKDSDLNQLQYDTLTEGGVYMLAGKVNGKWKLYTSKEANRTRGYFTEIKDDADIFILKRGTRGGSGRCEGYEVHNKDNRYLNQVTRNNYAFQFVTAGNPGLFVDSYYRNDSNPKFGYIVCSERTLMERTAGVNQYGRMIMTGDYRSPNPNIKFIKVADPYKPVFKYPNDGDLVRIKVTSNGSETRKTTEYVARSMNNSKHTQFIGIEKDDIEPSNILASCVFRVERPIKPNSDEFEEFFYLHDTYEVIGLKPENKFGIDTNSNLPYFRGSSRKDWGTKLYLTQDNKLIVKKDNTNFTTVTARKDAKAIDKYGNYGTTVFNYYNSNPFYDQDSKYGTKVELVSVKDEMEKIPDLEETVDVDEKFRCKAPNDLDFDFEIPDKFPRLYRVRLRAPTLWYKQKDTGIYTKGDGKLYQTPLYISNKNQNGNYYPLYTPRIEDSAIVRIENRLENKNNNYSNSFFMYKVNFEGEDKFFKIIENNSANTRFRAYNAEFYLDKENEQGIDQASWSTFRYDKYNKALIVPRDKRPVHVATKNSETILNQHMKAHPHWHHYGLNYRGATVEFIDVTEEILKKQKDAFDRKVGKSLQYEQKKAEFQKEISGYAGEIETAKSEKEDKLKDFETEIAAEEAVKDRTIQEFKDDILEEETIRNTTIETLKKTLQAELDTMIADNKEDLLEAEEEGDKSIADQRAKTNNILTKIRAKIQIELDERQAKIDEKQEQLDTKREEVKILLESTDADYQKQIADKKTMLNTAIDGYEQQLKTFDTKLQTAKMELEDKAREDKRKINETIELAEKNRDSRIETIREEGNRLIEEIENSLEEQKKIAEARVDRERKNAEIRINELKKQTYEREKKAKSDAIQTLQDEISQLERDVLNAQEDAALQIALAKEKADAAKKNSPAKKYLKSKVKISPDIQKYIYEELGKYADKNSLPSPYQLEQIKNITTNNTAERLASIPGMLNKFNDTTKTYMDFHNSYEDQLKDILETKFDAEKRANIEIQKRNSSRLNRLKSEIQNYADMNQINLKREELKSSKTSAGSLRNIGDGTMLNFDKTSDGRHVVVKMSGERLTMQDGEMKSDGMGDVQGCLTFDSNKNRLGTPALSCCNLNNIESPELSFRVKKINNQEEYNKLLTQISPESKSLATEYDSINYPFSVLEPQLSPGYCVSVEDEKVRVLPCEKDSNQRYRKLNYQVKTNCGVDK